MSLMSEALRAAGADDTELSAPAYDSAAATIHADLIIACSSARSVDYQGRAQATTSDDSNFLRIEYRIGQSLVILIAREAWAPD